MSYTSIYELFSAKVNCISELQNSYGSAYAMWNYISSKYMSESFTDVQKQKFWPIYKDKRLSHYDKAVLLSTYDDAFVEIDNLMYFSDACRSVHKEIAKNSGWSHFEAIGEIAENLYLKHDHRCKVIAIGCTSVCDIWEQEKNEKH